MSPDSQVRRLIVAGLGEVGCLALGAATTDEGRARAACTRVDVLVLDVGRSEAFETAMVHELRADHPDLRVLYLVGGSSPLPDDGLAALRHHSCLRKPFHLYDLCDLVSSWLDQMAAGMLTGLSMN